MKYNIVLTILALMVTQFAVTQQMEILDDHFLNDPDITNSKNQRPKNNSKSNRTVNRSVNSTIIGETTFDRQGNRSMGRRIYNYGNGKVSATYNISNQTDGLSPDRGTGYNYFDGNTWAPNATARLENSRHGYPHILSNGTNEIIISHQNRDSLNNNGLKILHRPIKGSGNWTETFVPSTFTNANIYYPVAALGGANDSTIHILAQAAAADTSFKVAGFDRFQSSYFMVYYKSTDLGQTWDIKDSVLAAFDTTYYDYHRDGSYTIDARGDVVTIAMLGFISDTKIIKSIDNGNTWTENTIIDLPNRYKIDDGLNLTSNSSYLYTPNEVRTSDKSGSVIIDTNNNVHLFFGIMYIDDSDTTDNSFYGTRRNGMLGYWNETFGDDSLQIISTYKDYTNDDTVRVQDLYPNITYSFEYNYGVSGLSMPSAGLSADNKLFVTYSALSEVHFDGFSNYRHIYLIKSSNQGLNWTEPRDFTPDFSFNLTENVYPSMAKNVDENVHIVYQEDYKAGSHILSSTAPVNNNNIVYLKVDTSLYEPVVSVNELQFTDFKIYPNPASNKISIDVDSRNEILSGQIYNSTGIINRRVTPDSKGRAKTIDITTLSKGIYFITVEFKSGSKLTKKFIKF